jgi:L-rhamnose mutarotase
MKRFGWVAKAGPDMVQKYVELHADVWPAVLARNKSCHLRNYSIFLKTLPNGEHWLFSYVEYSGEDFEADMKKMAADPEVQRWWAECKPCLDTVEDLPPGEVWATMEQVFYQA